MSTTPLHIVEVDTHRKMKSFVRFPFQLYRGNQYWAPPVDADELKTLTPQNPSLLYCDLQCILVYRGDTIVGRAALIINRNYNEINKKKMGRIGWLDFIDDMEVSKAIFDYAIAWQKERGMEELHGPLGFTDFDPQGMLFDGFDQMSTMATIYNYPYYNDHMVAYGFEKIADWHEGRVCPKNSDRSWSTERMDNLSKAIISRYGVSLAKVERRTDLLKYTDALFDLINLTYKDLYGFTPLTKEQIDYYVKNYFSFALKEYIPIVVDKNDRLIGFLIAFPSFTSALQKMNGKLFPFGFLRMLWTMKKHRVVDFYLGAVHPDYRNKGIMVLMFSEIIRSLNKRKIAYLETNIVLEDNVEMTNIYANHRNNTYQTIEGIKKRRSYFKKI